MEALGYRESTASASVFASAFAFASVSVSASTACSREDLIRGGEYGGFSKERSSRVVDRSQNTGLSNENILNLSNLRRVTIFELLK